MKEEFDRIHGRFDKLETKLDNHLDRLSRAEEAIDWLRGHIRVSTAIFIAVCGAIAAAYFNLN